jgi:flagellar basal body P-ring formation protein FlgA
VGLIRLFGLAALGIAGAAAWPAWAAVTVRVEAEVTVRGEEVSLGDLATVAGDEDLAYRLRQVRLGSAPAPGGSQRIDPDYVRLRLSESRLLPEHAQLILPDQVMVTRAYQVLMGAAIVEAASRQIQERLELGATSEEPYAVTALSRPADLRVPVGIVEIVAQVPPEPGQGAMGAEVTVKVEGRSFRTMLLNFRIGRLRPVLVAARPLESRAALNPGDWRVDRRASTEIPATALSAIPEGGDFEAAQAIREGEILTQGLVRRRLAVKRGDIVTLVVEGPGFRITTQGLALTDARRGDSLRVMNPTSKREALGKVEASGIVRVPFHGTRSEQ